MKQVFVDMDLNHFEFYIVALFPKTYFCLHLSSKYKYFKLYCLKILAVKKKKLLVVGSRTNFICIKKPNLDSNFQEEVGI